MPTNKRESLIFTVVMCFCMVFWMSCYNIARAQGGMSLGVISAAWMGLPAGYIFAMLCDWFIAGPLAKKVAFRLFVKPTTPSRLIPIIVSTCMVVPMVIIMSLFGIFESSLHLPGGIASVLPSLPVLWIQNIGWNFIMAWPFQIIIAGPVVRYLFRKAFPIGTVLAQPAKQATADELLHPARIENKDDKAQSKMALSL